MHFLKSFTIVLLCLFSSNAFPEIFLGSKLQQSRFQQMSDTIIGRIDEMGSRIDDLEKQIGDLIQHSGAGEDGESSPRPRSPMAHQYTIRNSKP